MMILGTFFSAFWLAVLGFTALGVFVSGFCAYAAILGVLGPDSSEERIRKHRRQQLMEQLLAVDLESDDEIEIIYALRRNRW